MHKYPNTKGSRITAGPEYLEDCFQKGFGSKKGTKSVRRYRAKFSKTVPEHLAYKIQKTT